MQKSIDDAGKTSRNAGPNAHSDMDEIMCRLLRELGYGKGVDIFEKAERWYE